MYVLLEHLDEHPRARRWEAERLHSQAELALEKSQVWPNVEIGGGLQKFRENSENSYYVEMSVPIPLFNRNQGAIKAALAGTRIAEKREQYSLLMLKNKTAEVFRDITAARAELIALNDTLIPAARKAYNAVSEAFRLGEEEYLSVIDAQRQLLESTRRQAELTALFFELKAELEGLTGTPLENIH
jgi:cobalt-zinc-cadmium efflux system outer membrane protein